MRPGGRRARRRMVAAALAASVAGGGSAAWWADGAERACREEAASWQATAASARTRLEDLAGEARRRAEDAKAATRAAEAGPGPEGRRGAAADTAAGGGGGERGTGSRGLLAAVAEERERRERPAEQNADARRHRTLWRDGAREFWRALALAPAQVERWLDAEEAQFLAMTDLETVARARGLGGRDPAVVALGEEIERRYEARLREDFGEAAWMRWDAFRQERWARAVAAAVGGLATLSGVPLTTEQGERLARAIAEATERDGRGRIAVPCRVDWAAVDARAKTFLAEAQWELFRTVEAPGSGGGGARFVTALNDALLTARRKDEGAEVPGR